MSKDIFIENGAEFGKTGFYIIDKNSEVIASAFESNSATENPVSLQRMELLKRAFSGEAVFTLSIHSDLHLTGKSTTDKDSVICVTDCVHPISMLFIVPIRDSNGVVLAVLAQQLIPAVELSGIMRAGWIGRSGESYLVDRDGFLLTQSRFNRQLYDVGLLHHGGNEQKKLDIRDPGGNLLEGFRSTLPRTDLPYTRMAENLLHTARSQTGWINTEQQDAQRTKMVVEHAAMMVDLEGYHDYRGVPVMGAWVWDHQLGLGIAVEIDVQEALAGFHSMRLNLIIITVITLLLTVIALLLTLMLGERAIRTMRRVQENLEARVIERTEALETAFNALAVVEERNRLILQSVGQGLFEVDQAGVVNFINDAAINMLGYAENEIIGRNIHSLIHHSYADGSNYSAEKCLLVGSFTEGRAESCDNELFWRKDGSSFAVAFSSSIMRSSSPAEEPSP